MGPGLPATDASESANMSSVPVEPKQELIAGRYELGPEIGRGGMGEVKRARDLRLGRDVAVKFLRADLAADPEVRGRFEDEARSAARLGHPNVVTIFDTSEHEGQPYIVMEYLPGRTLADELTLGPLSDHRARQLAVAVLGGLAAAHQVGVIHRDVKPANILFAADGTAKVVDFGIAKSTEGLDHTLAGQIIGTPAYLAPERLEGKRATPQSDLYSLGVVLYEALAGVKPFSGDTPLAVAHAVQTTHPVPLPQLRPDIDTELAETIEQAMDRNPQRRFSSADQMRQSLSSISPQMDAPEKAGPGEPTRRITAAPTLRQAMPAKTSVSPAPPAQPPGRPAILSGTRALALVAIVAMIVTVVVILAVRDQEPPARDPATTDVSPPPPGGTLPPALDEAIRRLEEAVRR